MDGTITGELWFCWNTDYVFVVSVCAQFDAIFHQKITANEELKLGHSCYSTN